MNKKGLTSALAVSVLSLSLGGRLFAAGADFGDLSGVAGREKIESLKSEGLVKGVSDTSFNPKAALTNAQGIQFIAGGLRLSLAAVTFEAGKVPTASDLFPAASDDAWYAEAFVNAHFNGVEIPESVDPSARMTKETYTHYLMQGLEKAGNLPLINIKPQPIADEGELTAEYQGSIQRALFRGIVQLDADGEFRPKASITRAEAAVMLYDALEFLKRQPDAPAPLPENPGGPERPAE
ncbi:S-layer homology domain-containing protein [Saccharibacillus sp. VR-M41]|uniref:S-layer homology domain-containing protein n=2 Tax=Saccharibacillus alkalitolerans TaxID=2705290 RepID=A0ABX0F7U1_9BACL|nr:S-layer homology domain-containing protein [Saccharibacillus alkalitolerans]NGZ77032.1 S-layer homology domain-containing protein [Saccharibacillus alkalitolerans]